MSPAASIAERVHGIFERITTAAERVGRDPADIELIAASKQRSAAEVNEAHAAGVHVFGENYVAHAKEIQPDCEPSTRWHLIGHLQTNKVRPAVRLFDTIHSVDSLRLLEKLDAEAVKQEKDLAVYLQVNISGEESKSGLPVDAVASLLQAPLGRTRIIGLMTMPPFDLDAEQTRPIFAALRELRDRLKPHTEHPLAGLSMGMSHDFDIAIEEGSTSIRIGTAIFGPRG